MAFERDRETGADSASPDSAEACETAVAEQPAEEDWQRKGRCKWRGWF